MEAIALFFTKFSDELIAAQFGLLFFALSLATYLLLIRKKKRETAEWVPAAIVRAYLDKTRADEAEVRFKLFGEASQYTAIPTQASHLASVMSASTSANVAQSGAASVDPNMLREIEALRAQLLSADQRSMEFDKLMNALKAEKAALEQKLAAAASATPAATAGGPSAEQLATTQKELDELKAKLQEYEVIEDDLANLKKFQKENEQLKQKVEQYEKGGSSTVVTGGAEKTQTPMTVITGGGASVKAAAAPSEATSTPVAEAAPAAPVAEATTTASPDVDTNVLQAVQPAAETTSETPAATAAPSEATPAPAAEVAPAAPAAEAPVAEAPATTSPEAAAPAPEKTAKQKEEELLSEFEKMLAS